MKMKCNFKPYEGDENYIFVSYSHRDSEKVSEILEELNRNGFRVWYDEGIEWGSEWPESIAKHLKKCSVCLAFHSKTSAESPNCKREINYALNKQKGILSVYLEDVELSDGIDMQLSSFQSTYPYQYSDIKDFYSRLTDTQILQSCRGVYFREKVSEPDGETKSFDREMVENYEKMFGENANGKKEKTTFEKKAEEIKSRNFMRNLSTVISETEDEETETLFNDNISLIPSDYNNSQGKHFSIPNLPGVKTVVYEVYECVDFKSRSYYYTYEAVDSVEQENKSGDGTQTTFFIDDPHSQGNQLIILHFRLGTNEVFVNTGLLYEDSVKMTMSPCPFALKKYSIDKDVYLSSLAYDVDGMSEEDKKKINASKEEEVWFEADVCNVPVIIIDPETAKPVLRKVFYDEKSEKFKAKIKLILNKSYFSFRIIDNDTGLFQMPLSDIMMGRYYRDGSYGFPKDTMQAISCYEKDGSPEAMYEMAVMFRMSGELEDKDTYLEYLTLAAEAGSEGAIVELALHCCTENCMKEKEKSLLKKLVSAGSVIGNFVFGALIELGYISGSQADAFDYYYASALDSYKPALARLCCDKNAIEQREALLDYYMKNINSGIGIIRYCIGCVLFFGLDIEPNEPSGLNFLSVTADAGNKTALYTLFEIYDTDDEYQDDVKALQCLKKITSIDLTYSNKCANRLLDGIGCEINDENDAYAMNVLKNAADSGDNTAIHNLAWMYKMGRGGILDYAKAMELFQEAKRPNSYYYLGDMYENGFGVPADADKAIEYYKMGVEADSKKAKERLEFLQKADE